MDRLKTEFLRRSILIYVNSKEELSGCVRIPKKIKEGKENINGDKRRERGVN